MLIEIDRAVIYTEIPRNSSLILEEKKNLKKILEEKKIPRFRPLLLSMLLFKTVDNLKCDMVCNSKQGP